MRRITAVAVAVATTLPFCKFGGKLADFLAAHRHPAKTFQRAGFRGTMKLDVEIDGRRELAGVERRHQRRPHGVVQHGGKEAALNVADRIQEFRLALEINFDGAAFGIDGAEREAQRSRAGRRRQAAIDHLPEERILVGHRFTPYRPRRARHATAASGARQT